MIFDAQFVAILVGTIIVGLLTVIIVGSQSHEDARSVAIWSFLILIPMLLVSCVRLAISGHLVGPSGDPGMAVFFSGMVAAIGIGYRIAVLRYRASQSILKGKKSNSGLWDNEII